MQGKATKTNVSNAGPKRRAATIEAPNKRPSLVANRLRQKKLGDGDDLFSRSASPHVATMKPSLAPSHSVTFTEPNSMSFAASIRNVDRPRDDFDNESSAHNRRPLPSRFSFRQTDIAPAAEAEAAAPIPAPQTPLPAEARVELEEGETIHLPDITLPPEIAAREQSDPIQSRIGYNPSITQSGPAPSGFGVTLPYTHALSGITVTRRRGTYHVQATVDNPITFQVGSRGNTDIESLNDADITAANYATVASDLTPDMSSDNGRPPRTQFWAEDLTIRHERFHAREDVHFGRQGVRLARQWLNTQDASSVTEVNTLLNEVLTRVADHVDVSMAAPAREERAYGDGAPAYRRRATNVQTRGDRGGY